MTMLPSKYGFCTSSTSMASPYACTDHWGGPGATASRQLKPDVSSTAAAALSLPPYADSGTISSMGKRAAYSVENTLITDDTTDSLTTIVPMCAWSSNPQ